MEASILPEETAEELAEVISPELKPRKNPPAILKPALNLTIDSAGSSILSQGAAGVTLLSIGGSKEDEQQEEQDDGKLKESFSAKL